MASDSPGTGPPPGGKPWEKGTPPSGAQQSAGAQQPPGAMPPEEQPESSDEGHHRTPTDEGDEVRVRADDV
jgi:hypothetical protein